MTISRQANNLAYYDSLSMLIGAPISDFIHHKENVLTPEINMILLPQIIITQITLHGNLHCHHLQWTEFIGTYSRYLSTTLPLICVKKNRILVKE